MWSTTGLVFAASSSNGDAGMLAGVGIFGFLCIIVFVLGIWALMWWKVFEKAGEPGWASIVPIYNYCVLFKISGKPMWWVVVAFIPFVGGLILIVLMILAMIDLAPKFGKDTGFAIGMILLPFVFFPILGFGSAQYSSVPSVPRNPYEQ
jgi:hypothetical protein